VADRVSIGDADRARSGALAANSPNNDAPVIVEQNFAAALSFAHRVYVLNNGHIINAGTPDNLPGIPRP